MEALGIVGDLGLNVLDDKDIARCKGIFEMYDEDKDGKLTYGELLTCLRCCGRNPTVEEFKELVQIVDQKLVRASLRGPNLQRGVTRIATCSLRSRANDCSRECFVAHAAFMS